MKERDLDKDTIVAYHAYLQTRIHSDLNSVGLGPAWFPCRMAIIFVCLSLASLITGILVITLRTRHVYLVDWWHAFLGPFFVILGLMCASLAVYLFIVAKRRSNAYRRELFFRPIGDYGVAVVHRSTLMHEQEHKSDLKSGTAPHRNVLPRSEDYSAYSHGHKHRSRQGHDNRGYSHNGQDDREHRRRHDDRGRHDDDRRRRDDDRRRHDDRERRDRDREGRRPRDDREPRRRDPDDREPRRRDPDDREPRRDDRRGERRRPREDRERGDREPEKRRPPPEDSERREPEKVRPDESERNTTQGGRRAVRGLPKIAVETEQQTQIVLDPDFGRPATDESEL